MTARKDGKQRRSAKGKVKTTLEKKIEKAQPIMTELKEGDERSKYQKQLDQLEMVRLLRRGWTISRIAEHFGLTETQVGYDMRVVLRDIRKERTKDVDALVTAKLEEYGEVKREAWDSWEKSKGPATKRTMKRIETSRGEATETTDSEEAVCGDPRFLKTVMECIEAERDLLGINAPKKIDVNATVVWDAFAGALEEGRTPERKHVDVIEQEIQKALEERRGDPKVTAIIPADQFDGSK